MSAVVRGLSRTRARGGAQSVVLLAFAGSFVLLAKFAAAYFGGSFAANAGSRASSPRDLALTLAAGTWPRSRSSFRSHPELPFQPLRKRQLLKQEIARRARGGECAAFSPSSRNAQRDRHRCAAATGLPPPEGDPQAARPRNTGPGTVGAPPPGLIRKPTRQDRRQWEDRAVELAKKGGVTAALQYLEETTQDAGARDKFFAFNSVMKQCVQSSDVDGAKACLQSMLDSGIEVPLSGYKQVLQLQASTGDRESVQHILDVAISNGVVPDFTVYKKVLTAHVKGSDAQGAVRVLRQSLDAGFKHDIVAYNSVVDVLAKAGEMRGASGIADLMVKEGCGLNVNTFNSLLKGFAQLGKQPNLHGDEVGKAEMLFESMPKFQIAPDLITFNTMINAHTPPGNVPRAEALLKSAVEAGLTPDQITYNSVINACAKSGQGDRASSWLAQLVSAGLEADARSHNSVLNAYATGGDARGAELFLRRMVETVVAPDVVGWTMLIKACAANKPKSDPVGAEWCLTEMVAARVVPNTGTYNYLSEAVGPQRCSELRRELLKLIQGRVPLASSVAVGGGGTDSPGVAATGGTVTFGGQGQPTGGVVTFGSRSQEPRDLRESPSAPASAKAAPMRRDFGVSPPAPASAKAVPMPRDLRAPPAPAAPAAAKVAPTAETGAKEAVEKEELSSRLLGLQERQHTVTPVAATQRPVAPAMSATAAALAEISLNMAAAPDVASSPALAAVQLGRKIEQLKLDDAAVVALMQLPLGEALALLERIERKKNFDFSRNPSSFVYGVANARLKERLQARPDDGLDGKYNAAVASAKEIGKAGKVKEALDMLLDMQIFRKLEPSTFEAVAASFAEAEKAEKAEQLLEVMHQAAVEPDMAVLRPLCLAACKCNDGEVSEKLLGEALSRGFEVPPAMLHRVLSLCEREANLGRAERVLEQASGHGFTTDDLCMKIMIKTAAMAGEKEDAEIWFDKLVTSRVQPQIWQYNDCVRACAADGDVFAATGWLSQAVAAGLELNVYTHWGVMQSASKNGKLNVAEIALERIQAGFDAGHAVWTDFIRVCARATPIASDRAERAFRDMVASGVAPTYLTVQALSLATGPQRCIVLCKELGVHMPDEWVAEAPLFDTSDTEPESETKRAR
eukprot:CAMPEP_0204140356 /NCGR_PEP_ID=MMETSP0361-20130328/18934_1 /ASSEMBLY_ACC=CAM_ASM_000343 /TAXON_ID=268821 /ORGANISM="Scrippsiella Hangoei, Strain SHTV-5" /LENGTH=1137 /DNA_ID=CAMNT_0051094165 /DNA_START=187 /DNA_END=3597 /DNA_ORIENTATION=-